MEQENSFLGTGWAFPPEFTREGTGGTLMVSGVEDINQSLEILFSTRIGERITQLEYGSSFQEQVFRAMNGTMINRIRKQLEYNILNHEPRIVMDQLEIWPDQAEGILYIDLTYTVIATNSRYNLVYPYYLKEATNVQI